MKIRPATQADVPLLSTLADKTWRACYPGIISLDQIEYMLRWMYSPSRIHEELKGGVFWEIMEKEGSGNPVGFLAYEMTPEGRVKLHKLYVLPEEQRKGIGQQGLKHVLSRARLLGASDVWLQVNKRNHPAVTAYQKAGFKIVDEDVFDIGQGFVMDDYLMSKSV